MITKKGKIFDANFKSRYQRLIWIELPRVLVNDARNHFLEGFRKGGGQTDKSKGGWRPRKSNSPRNNGRALLVDTGNMRSNVRVTQVSFSESKVSVPNIRYAIYHNEGTQRLPQREFIGQSRELEAKSVKKIQQRLNKAFNTK